MVKRDILQVQIEQIGKAIGHGLALLAGLDTAGNSLIVIDEVATVLDTEVDIDLKKWMGLEQEAFEKVLKEKLHDKESIIERLGDLLFETAKHCGPEGALRQHYLQKALWTFNYLNQVSITFSMDRLAKIRAIKEEQRSENRE